MTNISKAIYKNCNVLFNLNIKEIIVYLINILINILLIKLLAFDFSSPSYLFISFIQIFTSLLAHDFFSSSNRDTLTERFISYCFTESSFRLNNENKSEDQICFEINSLKNINSLNSSELDLVNTKWLYFLKELYKHYPDLEIKHSFKIINESRSSLFHPKINLFIEFKNFKVKPESFIQKLKKFFQELGISYQQISNSQKENQFKKFFEIKDSIRNRKDFIKSKYYITSLVLSDFQSKNHKKLLLEILKSFRAEAKLSFNLYSVNHRKLKQELQIKIFFLKYILSQSEENQKILEGLEELLTHIKNYSILKQSIYINFKAKSLDELNSIKSNFKAMNPKLRFIDSDFINLDTFLQLDKINKNIIREGEIKSLNPFIEDLINNDNAESIAYRLADQSLVKFNFFDRNYSNNNSINFIGDSGSGKSLAAKILMTKNIKNKSNKFIIIDSSLQGWEKLCENINAARFELKEADQKHESYIDSEKQVNFFNFYRIEHNQKLSISIITQIFTELNTLVEKQEYNYFLVIDEAWKLLNLFKSQANDNFISKISRTGRAMNIGLWVISQKPSDFERDILSNAANSFIFQCKEKEDKNEIEAAYSLSEEERESLNSKSINERGTCLLKNQNYSALIKILIPEEDSKLYSSEYKVKL